MAKKQKGKGKEEPVSAPLPSVPEAVDPPEDSLHTHTHIVDIHSVEQDAPINVMPMDLGESCLTAFSYHLIYRNIHTSTVARLILCTHEVDFR